MSFKWGKVEESPASSALTIPDKKCTESLEERNTLSKKRAIKDELCNDGANVVKLLIYDMTNGGARRSALLQLGGDRVEGIWHAGVYVFGREYSFGTKGVKEGPPMRDRKDDDCPERMKRIGETSKSFPEFKEFLEELSTSLFTAWDYSLLNRNCIIFSQVLCKFLCGESVPKYLLDLPKTVVRNPLISIATAGLFNILVAKFPYDIIDDLINTPPSEMLSFLKCFKKRNMNPGFPLCQGCSQRSLFKK